jgi:Flavin-binding monooxygenase-like
MTNETHIAIIGAGPSGIAAAKNCIQAGLSVTVFEKNTVVGGNWVFNSSTGHSSVYENTHIISSKDWSEYEDFPMPASYPAYPHHSQLASYFASYARHFKVQERVRFSHTVTQVRKIAENDWRIDFLDAEQHPRSEHFTHLMVANGHHWHPRWPEIQGEFAGQYLHSHDFKGVNDEWRGKRVLVIGAGNSACDVAVEAARLAAPVSMSMRSPQWFIPKFIFGKPSDVYATGTMHLPVWLRQRAFKFLLQNLQGKYADIGLPEHHLYPLQQHPTLNSDLIDYVRHGKVLPRPGISRFEGSTVHFSDGSSQDFDIIVACTGFRISFPFFEDSLVPWKEADRTPLLLRMLPADHKDLYFIGLFQPLGCIWPMADMQARLAVKEIQGQWQRPADMQAAIQHEMDHPHYDFERAPRHSTEVDYHRFRAELRRELAKAGVDIGKAPAMRRGGVKRPQGLPA